MLCSVLNNNGRFSQQKFCNIFVEQNLFDEKDIQEVDCEKNIPSYFFVGDISKTLSTSKNIEDVCFIAKNPVELMHWFSKGGIFGFIKTSAIANTIEKYTKWMDFCRVINNENAAFYERASFPFEKKIYLIKDCEKFSSVIHTLFSDICPGKDIKTGLYELLINAFEHGNFGIDKKYKEELIKSGNLISALMMAFNENLDKYVHVLGEVTMYKKKKAIRISVKDFGKGFDWQKAQKQDVNAYTGRGLILAKGITFDKIEFNNKGNCVEGYMYINP